MTRFPILKHLGFAIAILVGAVLFFTYAPFKLTPPELLSPWAYGLAALLALAGLFRIQPRKRIWIYLPILILCILGVLEETSYGVESGGVQPIYNETYNVQIYDLHNLIPILEQIFTKDLERADWNFELSSQFLRADGVILVAAALFIIAAQWRAAKSDPTSRSWTLLAASAAALSLAASAWLLSLPADAKNALLFGYSALRLGMLLTILVVGFAPLALALRPVRRAAVQDWITSAHGRKRNRVLFIISLVLLLIASIVFQIWAPLSGAAELATVSRATPLVLWATALGLLLLIAIHTWAGSLQSLLSKIRLFFANNPAYIYFFFCLFTIAFSQAMDQDRISLAQYISFTNPKGDDWNYWLEEAFEMTGALQLAAATFFYPHKRNGTQG